MEALLRRHLALTLEPGREVARRVVPDPTRRALPGRGPPGQYALESLGVLAGGGTEFAVQLHGPEAEEVVRRPVEQTLGEGTVVPDPVLPRRHVADTLVRKKHGYRGVRRRTEPLAVDLQFHQGLVLARAL